MLKILVNTKKHITRSGWIGWASIFVMTLAFLVVNIFGGLAYVANLYIQYIEQRSNLLVFFEVGTNQEIIDRLNAKWSADPRIKEIGITTEEEAYEDYADFTEDVQPQVFEVLSLQEEKKLPASLDIQINSLDDLDDLRVDLKEDIDEELIDLIIIDTESARESERIIQKEDLLYLSTTEYQYSNEAGVPPITLRVDSESLDQLKDVLTVLRIGGVAIITLLFVVIFFFTFMTVEFRLYNQMEEIGVMQLVGGSLSFIRMPYILEGGWYGMVGALLSSSIISAILFAVLVIYEDSTFTVFLHENFGQLPWPEVTYLTATLAVGAITLVGFIVGALSSYLSIRRYIR